MADLDATAITLASGEEPFTVEPFIKFMLSTRRCLPSSIFIVEGLDLLPLSESKEKRAVRLLLGDGELCIQAILHSELFPLVEDGTISVGCYVRVDDFLMRFEEPSEFDEESRGKAGLVYLIVNELQTVGWNETYVGLWKRHQKGKEVERPSPGVHTTEETSADATAERVRPATPPRDDQFPAVRDVEGAGEGASEAGDDLFAAYEALAFPSRDATPKAKKKPATALSRAATATATTTAAAGTSQQPLALPQDWHSHHIPLKLTTLRSIPHLPYTQNWAVNVLAIIVSLSDVEPSHLPPGRQRVARIADPSTSKHVHLTVFLNPEDFQPKVGSAVLLTGVKNHRFDGGCLKKYASDGKKVNGRQWWFEDPWEMTWLDVKGIKAWWREMKSYT